MTTPSPLLKGVMNVIFGQTFKNSYMPSDLSVIVDINISRHGDLFEVFGLL